MIRIGCGGWQYFDVGNLDPLEWYAKAYDFVEVNSTFYTIPKMETVKSWRLKVPEEFEFTVKAHRDLTHKYNLKPQKECFETFEKMKEIGKVLKSEILVFETPPHFVVEEHLDSVKDFFSSADTGNLRVAWEMRCYKGRNVPEKVTDFMQYHNMVHCVDFSTSKPAFESDITYTRLFGKGSRNVYQFTDRELAQINEQVENLGSKKKLMNFHGVRMYKDAARLILFRRTGRFPKATNHTGQKSLEEVLGEDAHFPTTKKDLIESQGWKLIDLTEDKRILVSEILETIPDRSYSNVEDVVEQVKSLL